MARVDEAREFFPEQRLDLEARQRCPGRADGHIDRARIQCIFCAWWPDWKNRDVDLWCSDPKRLKELLAEHHEGIFIEPDPHRTARVHWFKRLKLRQAPLDDAHRVANVGPDLGRRPRWHHGITVALEQTVAGGLA